MTRAQPETPTSERYRGTTAPLFPRNARITAGPDTLNLLFRTFRSRPLPPAQFHVLLNSLFKVLFTFPSWYLCAIGLVVIFSLRWSLPPT